MSDNRIIECMERAQYLLGNLMAVKPGEEVLIVVDPQTDERMTQAMAAAALNCGAEYGVYMMPIRGKDKATIFPKSLELGMDACDVFVGMTTASGAAIYNNHLKELINQKKLREVSICLRSIDNFTRGGALADYEAVYADGEKLQAIWRGHKMAHITTPAGTDLYMEMNQMEPIIECGIARNPGDAMAWSDGEVSLGPVIDTTHGKLVIDGPICYYGCPTTPVELRIEKGRIVEVVGGDPKICKEIRRQIAEVKDSDNIAEIGLGLNPACMFNGDFEEEKKAKGAVDKQVYALWNILQKRNFRYSSVSNTSLSSNVVFSQRVRTFDDALESSQINCVDGSVLFASLLRAINIDPILVRTPGHMFVGYYTDNSHTDMNFLETTMIGDVDLDDFFPDEQLDSTMVGKSQNEMSLLTFEKSKQYANKKYKENEEGIHSGKLNYMFLEISKEVRRKIQPIGK